MTGRTVSWTKVAPDLIATHAANSGATASFGIQTTRAGRSTAFVKRGGVAVLKRIKLRVFCILVWLLGSSMSTWATVQDIPAKGLNILIFNSYHVARTRDLDEARIAADEANRAKSEFLANMSHEIRTPLNAVLGMLYLALQQNHTPAVRNHLIKANGSAQSLLHIINDIPLYRRWWNMLLSKQVSTNAHPFHIQWLILGLALLALGGAIGYAITHEHNRIDALEQDRLATQAKVVALNLEQQLVALNRALVGIRNDLPYWKAQKNDKTMANLRLQAMSDAMPGVRTLHITDTEGTVFASNRKELIGLNFRDREYFRAARQGLNQDMLYISPPFKTVLEVYAVNAVKVVLDAQGKFAGIVSSTLDPEYCTVLLESVRYTPGMRASLIHGDGKIFVEVPDRKDLAGMDLAKPGSRYTLHKESGREANIFTTGRAFATGDFRMSAWRTIRPASLVMDKPLMISVNRDMQGIFAHWRRDAFIQGGLFGALLLVAVFGLYLYQRRQQKHDHLAASYMVELQESEENYRSLFQNASIGIFHSLPEGKFLRVNPALAQMLGYESPAEMVSAITNISTQIYIDSKKHSTLLDRTIEQTDWVFAENRYRRKDGTILTANLAVRKVLNSDSTVAYLEGFAEDITERKRAEEALRHANLVIENSPVVLFRWRAAEGWPVEMVSRNVNLFGYTQEELLSGAVQFSSMVHPEDLDRVGREVQEYSASGKERFQQEYRIIAKDGRVCWVDDRTLVERNADGQITHYQGIIIDITERKRAEDDLRKLLRAVEQSPVTVVIADLRGTIEFVNPSFTGTTGYTREEVIGQNPRVWKSGVHPPAFYKELWETIRAGNVWHGEFCNRKKNGELYWEAAVIAPVRDMQGKITHFVAIKEDITGMKRLTDELRHAKEAAEAANRAKSDFLANMSHELRTPLNSIIGFSELLEDGVAGPIADNQKELANDISTSGKHLLSLINDILDLSKVEAGKMELELGEFNLEELIDGSLVMFKEKAMKHNIKIAAEVEEGIGDIIADERKIKQVLYNLLSNAMKFTPDGGSVAVNARPLSSSESGAVSSEQERIYSELRTLNPELHGNFVEISVADTGIGISPEDQEKLFQPFQQIDSALSRKYSGTGLGLNLCRKFIELHGGRIWIESEVGKGSKFTFIVPAQGNPSAVEIVEPATQLLPWEYVLAHFDRILSSHKRTGKGFGLMRMKVFSDKRVDYAALAEILKTAVRKHEVLGHGESPGWYYLLLQEVDRQVIDGAVMRIKKILADNGYSADTTTAIYPEGGENIEELLKTLGGHV